MMAHLTRNEILLGIVICFVNCAIHGTLQSEIGQRRADDGGLTKITDEVLDEAFQHGKQQQQKRKRLENDLLIQGKCLDPTKTKTPGGRHQLFPDRRDIVVKYEDIQTIFDEASKFLINKYELNSHEAVFSNKGLKTLSLDNSTEAISVSKSCRIAAEHNEVCPQNFRYRSFDGKCNNRENPLWGKSYSCLSRLHDPDFADFQSAPRVSVTTPCVNASEKVTPCRRKLPYVPLPNPRQVSNALHQEVNRPAYTTHMFMQWGQFLAHDLSFTPTTQMENGMMFQCCPNGDHPECFPIEVSQNDSFYSTFQKTCLNFVRSASCPTCKLGPREFVNQQTSFIDLSQVYGSSGDIASRLRNVMGKLSVTYDNNRRPIPIMSFNMTTDQCSYLERRMYCFQTGDPRANQHLGLLSLHVLFLREHNRIAQKLMALNPNWNSENIFQETRRILGAVAQVITYKEYLPVLLGTDTMNFYELNMLENGYTHYLPMVNPSIFTEFSTAAFRAGHTMIGQFYEIFPSGNSRPMSLKDHFFYPFGLYNGQVDHVLAGLVQKPSQEFDPYIVDEVRNHLYQVREQQKAAGTDLPAFNIQRGRDHGIPGYTKYLERCFSESVNSFEELDRYMPKQQRLKFSSLYRSVHDIDLFSGGISETPLPDGFVGPTFACIIGIQFRRLKFGDRYYVEHGRQIGTFSPDQLETLRKASLANILCRNTDGLDLVRPLVMIEDNSDLPNNNNMVSCEDIQDLDFSLWQEHE